MEPQTSKSHHLLRNVMLVLLVLLLIGATAAATYIYQNRQTTQRLNEKQVIITKLEQQVADLTTQLNDAKDTSSSAATVPSMATLENIEAAITSGNTAALQSYMAPTVTVVIAASEGVGNRTPAQAISDLVYIKEAKNWNFNIDTATITLYAKGDYKTYFKANSLIGKASDGKVIAFNFNDQGKINGIFMAVNDDLLK